MQTLNTPGVVPVHHQIADWLRARIASGELAPGQALPSVSELCERWSCAPLTARRAVDVLKGEGLISGGRGKPATVRKQPPRVRLTLDNSQETKRLVLRPSADRSARGAIEQTAGISIEAVTSTHKYTIIRANDEVSRELDIPEGMDVLRRLYEMTDPETNTRIAWSISYIPVALIEANPKLLDENMEPWPGGHQHQLYTVGIEIDRFERSVTALGPSPGERKKWGMDEGVPLIYVRSRSIDTSDRVVEFSDAAYPADRTEIYFTEKLDRWPKNYPRYEESGE